MTPQRTGPLTNIALAAETDIQTLRRVKQIVIMGGAFFTAGNITPHAEYNMCVLLYCRGVLATNTFIYCRYADPEAAQVTCDAGLPLVFVPLDATHCVPYERYFSVVLSRSDLSIRFEETNLLPWKEKSALAKFIGHLTEQAYSRKGTWPGPETLCRYVDSYSRFLPLARSCRDDCGHR